MQSKTVVIHQPEFLPYPGLFDRLLNADIQCDQYFSCPQLYQRLVIGTYGSAMMCANDEKANIIVGYAKDQTIYDIWHVEGLRQIRELNRKNALMKNTYLPKMLSATVDRRN